MDVGRDVAGCPDQLEVVVGRQAQHEVHSTNHVAMNAAMLGSDAEATVAGRHVSAVLPQPDVDVVNRVVGIAELDRERDAVNAWMVKRNPLV